MNIITIGRSPNNRIAINNQKVSTHHAEIQIDDFGNYTLVDSSMNGTTINGREVHNSSVTIHRGDSIIFGKVVPLDWNQVPTVQNDSHNFKHSITIGTNPDNKIQIFNDKVSRYHAKIKIDKKNRLFINDQSSNGTFVNGSRISKNSDFPIKRGDRVNFANVQELDWSKIPKAGLKPVLLILPIFLALIGAGIYFNYDKIEQFFRPNISERYKNSIGLIYNSYYLAYVDNKDTLYYIGADYQVADLKNNPYSKNTIRPFEITGSGFYVSGDGKIITNKHVAAPWESDLDVDKERIEKTINILRASVGQLIVRSRVVGVRVKTGIFPNNSTIEKNDVFKNMLTCNVLNWVEDINIDLAVIQLESKQIPTTVMPITDIVSTKDEIKLGEEIIIFGYPFGFDLATKNQDHKIMASFDQGRISKISDRYEIQYNAPSFHGASGSPVFNKDGKLIAVNYAGIEKSQGYNFGIIATHIKKLVED
jgi:pSer/pThr/pTyr-binding forkhead associated (FHA) protein